MALTLLFLAFLLSLRLTAASPDARIGAGVSAPVRRLADLIGESGRTLMPRGAVPGPAFGSAPPLSFV